MKRASKKGWTKGLDLLLRGGTLLFCLVCLTSAQTATRLNLRFADIPASFHEWLREQGIQAGNFEQWLDQQTRETVERERRGEFEHLIYYALQSNRFTSLPKIEPALSARVFAQSLSATDRDRWLAAPGGLAPALTQLPKPVAERLREFSRVLQQATTDERLRYFQQFTRQQEPVAAKWPALLAGEYVATMRFLYRKEVAQPDASAAQVAALYQSRGHSTDTQIEANFAVSEMLAMLQSGQPKLKLNHVLIVGPGLDFAPRTDLLDLFGPQSYQPFAVADALLRLGLADEQRLRIHCVDINNRVIDHLQRISQSKALQLALLSGVADSPALPLSDDFKTYFTRFGQAIGLSGPLAAPAEFGKRLSKRLTVRPELLAKISADKLNIITERYEPSPAYDLIVVTNVFPYFSDVELLSGLTNLGKMLAEQGCLVHNEPRVTAPLVSRPLDLPVLSSRTFLLAAPRRQGVAAPLYDFAGLHQRTITNTKN